MANYAHIESRTAYLSTDFGEEIARKWFGHETVDSLPRYASGPRKGKIKGAVTWSKVLHGGWIRAGSETGYVENRVGRVFDRKLHEIESSRFGTHIGKVIRDLEAEERKEQYRQSINARIDEEIRKYEMERTLLEQVILSGKFDDRASVFQRMIAECNEDIAILCSQFQ